MTRDELVSLRRFGAVLDGYSANIPTVAHLPPRTSGEPVLCAVIGTWFEGDVIAATVRNCFANGCTRVLVVDNDSPDETKEQAVAAGATIAADYRTELYDDTLRLRTMNDVAAAATAELDVPELWWLSLDADEFPCGPDGQPVLQYLQSLHEQYSVVGADVIDLYPSGPETYMPGDHPADRMPLGMRHPTDQTYCLRGHWKHPLLRAARGRLQLRQPRGSHTPFSRPDFGQTLEPPRPLVVFHAPFRNKDVAARRLRALCGGDNRRRSAGDDASTGGRGAITRWRSLDAVYAQRWSDVELYHPPGKLGRVVGVSLCPWQELVNLTAFPRW